VCVWAARFLPRSGALVLMLLGMLVGSAAFVGGVALLARRSRYRTLPTGVCQHICLHEISALDRFLRNKDY